MVDGRDPRNSKGGTVVLENIDAKNRSEMYCPKCGKQSIGEHPIAAEYPTKKAKIIKGSQCTNENCDKGLLSQEEVKMQYNPEGFIGKLTDVKNLSLLIGGLFLLGLVLSFGFGYNVPVIDTLFAPTEVTVSGTIADSNGNPISDATVEYGNQEVTTDSSGQYQIEDIEVGEYTVNINPPSEEQKGLTATVSIASDGVTVADDAVASQLYTVSELQANYRLPARVSVVDEFEAYNTTKELRYVRETHTESATATISPLDTEELRQSSTETITTDERKQISASGDITQSTVTGIGYASTESFTETGQSDARGRSTLNVQGNANLESASLQLNPEEGIVDRTETVNIQSNSSDQFTVNGSVIEDASLTLRGGAEAEAQELSGEWSAGNDPLEISIDEEDAPSTATLELTGDIETQEQSITGSVSGENTQTIEFETDGSLPPESGQISFPDGTLRSSTVGSETISASGEDETTEQTSTITTASQDGQYTIEYDLSINRSPEYIRGGYAINGDRTQVAGSGTETVELSEGDTIRGWVVAEKQQLEPVDHTTNSSISVVSVDMQSTNLNVGQSSGVRATIENTSSINTRGEVVLYADSSVYDSQVVSLEPDEEETIIFDRLSFDEAGVYPVQVNNSSVIDVTVGGAELDYGEATLSTEVDYLSTSGSVDVDTNGSGSPDCTVSVGSDSTCDIELSTGQNAIDITQNGVSDVSYEINYTSRSGAEDIQADMTGNGSNEIDYSGVLEDGETISNSVSLSEGDHTIQIETGNGEPVEYALRWTQSGVISNPEVVINGSEVVSVNEVFEGEQTFTVDRDVFVSGTNNIQLQTEDDQTHTIILEWTEQGLETYPTVQTQDTNEILCRADEFTSNNSCDLSDDISVGGNQVQFIGPEQSPQSNIQYEFSHTARNVPTTITLYTEDGEEVTTFTQSDAQETEQNGTWRHTQEISLNRNTSYEISVPSEENFSTQAEVEASYTAERNQAIRPVIRVETAEGSTEEFPVPEEHLNSDGELVETATVEIPNSAFERGVNTITFTAENEGVYNVEFVGTEDG